MPSTSRSNDLYLHLKGKGADVYLPSQKEGECTSPYVVVKEGTTTTYRDFSSTATLYELLCYVPEDRYSTLVPYVEMVKRFMSDMYPMMRPTYTQTPPFHDTQVKGFMVSIQYVNYRKVVR